MQRSLVLRHESRKRCNVVEPGERCADLRHLQAVADEEEARVLVARPLRVVPDRVREDVDAVPLAERADERHEDRVGRDVVARTKLPAFVFVEASGIEALGIDAVRMPHHALGLDSAHDQLRREHLRDGDDNVRVTEARLFGL
jgi:hypothetical protein